MQMTGSEGLFTVPPEHAPGLVALLVLVPVAWLAYYGLRVLARRRSGWAEDVTQRLDRLGTTATVVVLGSLVGAAVHAALVPTHWADDQVLATWFVVDAVAFSAVAGWTFIGGRLWKPAAALVLGGTAGAYLFYVLRGWESMDLVGVLTTTIELAAALVVIFGATWSQNAPGRRGWLTFAALPVALATLLGVAAIADTTGAASASDSASSASASPAMADMSPTAPAAPLSLATTSAAGPIVWPDDMGSMAAGMSMVTPDCTTQPTAAQQHAAVALVDQTVAGAAPYQSLAAARAAGYVPVTPTGQKVVHYINPSIYGQGRVLDPSAIPVLVYVNTSHGAVLSAAMYLMPPAGAGASPPQPGGCLTQWHIHTDLCFSNGKVVGSQAAGTCAAGSTSRVTEPMMHVWLTPVTGGPLAPDPPARSQVAAAQSMPPATPPNATA
jgi:hypothetical protein